MKTSALAVALLSGALAGPLAAQSVTPSPDPSPFGAASPRPGIASPEPPSAPSSMLGQTRPGPVRPVAPPSAEDRQRMQAASEALVRRYAHPVYNKQVTRTKMFKARNDLGAKAGDTVRIMETRPLAKTVSWRVTEIVERAK